MNSISMRVKWFCLSALLMLSAHSVNAELRVTVTKGISNAQPIAIVPFGWANQTSAAPEDISGVITADLERSGEFKAIAEDKMLTKPISGQLIRFENWRALGINHLVVGNLRATAKGRYAIDFQLFDVIRGKQIIGRSLQVSQSRLRRTAHHISDLIYEALTGLKGAFDTRIAYVSVDRSAKKPVYRLQVADADGFNPRTVVQSSQPLLSPTWSPDGVHLAYVSFRNRQAQVFAMNLKTGKDQALPGYEGVNGAPAFSPDGEKLAMALSKNGNVDVYVLDMLSKKLSRLTTSYSIETEPTWSADGRKILFTSSRVGGPQIYSVDIASKDTKRMSFDGKYNASAAVSPDGRYVSMIHSQRGKYRVGLLDNKNGYFRVLTKGTQDESPSFSPNGRMILYASKKNGKGVLSAVSVDGRVEQQLNSTGEDIREPAWSPFSK